MVIDLSTAGKENEEVGMRTCRMGSSGKRRMREGPGKRFRWRGCREKKGGKSRSRSRNMNDRIRHVEGRLAGTPPLQDVQES
jgi:hypothetical protein